MWMSMRFDKVNLSWVILYYRQRLEFHRCTSHCLPHKCVGFTVHSPVRGDGPACGCLQ